jgi:methylmalonyl-CoA mutase N-terminal domain/subunit
MGNGGDMVERKSESGIIYDSTPISTANLGSGEFPYRSGIHQGMYTIKPWTIRQYAGFGNPKEANLRLKSLIESGVTGLSIAFDLPTQMGLDPDDELASAEVGKVGVSISNLEDMRKLFEGIDISKISTSMTINATAPIILLMYQIIGEERGIEPNALRGTIQNDILKEYIARGTYIFPPSKSLELATETIIYCRKYLPNWNSISISGYHMSEAGATAVQEVAFTFSNAITYLNYLIQKGIQIDDIAPRISFFFSARITMLEEIAKFRAAREVWASIVKDQFGAKNPKSWQLRFHAQTAGVQLIAQNPELNIVRVALQALGAVFGGTQSLHANAFDEAIALPSDTSARIALQTQQIIMEETDLTSAIDPFKGSFLLENMTNEMIHEINRELMSIDALGGALQGIQIGYQLDKIEANAFRIAREVEDGSKRVIGLNIGKSDQSVFPDSDFSLSTEMSIVDVFRSYKESRDMNKIEPSLNALRVIASSDGALLPAMKVCLLAGATVGEICAELSSAWSVIKY